MPNKFKTSFIKNLINMAVALLFAAILPSSGLAHSIFIQSSRYIVNENKASPLFFCFGHHIPVDDGVRANKLKYVKIIEPSGKVRSVQIRPETCLHSYMVKYDKPGTYVLTAETNPGYYTVYIDKKGRKRHAMKPKDAIIQKAQKVEMSLYSNQYTKTYVVCEKPSAEFPSRISQPLELVPTRDISTVKPGEDLKLEIYYNGEKYNGEGAWDATYNGYSTEPEDYFYPRKKINGNKFSVPVIRSGRWFVRYFLKQDAIGEDAKKCNHLKYTATLVFQVPNEKDNKQ